jgi:hypothetical protein
VVYASIKKDANHKPGKTVAVDNYFNSSSMRSGSAEYVQDCTIMKLTTGSFET